MPSLSGRLSFVSVKSFGDLVITATMLARLAPEARDRVTLLAGRHLSPLLAVLTPSVRVRFLDVALDGPAPLFDMRKLGPLSAARNAVALRAALGRDPARGETLVFDRLGVRERYLAYGRRAAALPPADNIYDAYEALLVANGLTLDAVASAPPARDLVRIFAGARMTHRQPPLALIRSLVERATARGARAEVLLLEGERPELEKTDLPVVMVPRDFGAMRAAIDRADAVISPDSMTAHLAEHCAKPVLVVTPVPKFYWMPRFAARHGTIQLFDRALAGGPFDDFMSCYVTG